MTPEEKKNLLQKIKAKGWDKVLENKKESDVKKLVIIRQAVKIVIGRVAVEYLLELADYFGISAETFLNTVEIIKEMSEATMEALIIEVSQEYELDDSIEDAGDSFDELDD